MIALIITIIVLLILAGVTISMLSGENGILTQAVKAKKITEEESIAETLKMILIEYEIDNTVDIEERIEQELEVDEDMVDKLATGIYAVKLPNEVAIVKQATGEVSFVSIWSGEVAEGFASGDGSQENPYIIETAEQLAYYSQAAKDLKDKHIKLNNDIMLNWDVLDDEGNLNPNREFNLWKGVTINSSPSGSFDGNYHVVCGEYVTRYLCRFL